MKGTLSPSRRDFLKLSALSLGLVAARPYLHPGLPMPPEESYRPGKIGRVTTRSISVHSQPDLDSPHLERIERDSLLELLEEIISPNGPDYNPRWYRIAFGYIHSAYIQRIKNNHLNQPQRTIPEAGLPGEITVPFTQSYYTNRQGQRVPMYRLYYGSCHWITSVEQALDGIIWYNLTDEWLKVQYQVPAEHVYILPVEAYTPLAAEVPAEDKRLVVSIEEQTLTAYEGSKPVMQTRVSTGRRYMETPRGEFYINRKTPSKHMGNGALTNDLRAYELPGVPWVSFFHTNGVAFHGTYWHDNFGTPMSQGCVNLRSADASWVFRWCTPLYDSNIDERGDWRVRGKGTPVQVI